MTKKKSKKLKVKRGSRLKLKEGLFARVMETPKEHLTTIKVKVYNNSKYELDPIRNIPFGHIAQIVRY